MPTAMAYPGRLLARRTARSRATHRPSAARLLAQTALYVVMSVLWMTSRSAWSAEDSFKQLQLAPVPAGMMAVPFNMPSLDGPPVASGELSGKVVVLNFWATWCGPCKDEIPAFERLRRYLDRDRFAVLTVTTDLQRDGIRQFLKNLDAHLPVLFDEDQEVSRAYLVRALPTTIILTTQGAPLARAVGPRDWGSPETLEFMRSLAEPHE